ncbi:MAG TPA: 1-acyl-sn-glycerol-3-phosphate acyltransferase, partial [Micromonosporaceae bacterium]|nr:1-acyl-sn-glycerol-3-phosphate acyltransferase [Micromonosporaceae bacterium]
GDDTLWASLRRVVAVRELTITITAAPAVHPADSATRQALARIAESAVRMVPVAAARPVPDPVAPKPGSSVLVLPRPEPTSAGPEVLGLAA